MAKMTGVLKVSADCGCCVLVGRFEGQIVSIPIDCGKCGTVAPAPAPFISEHHAIRFVEMKKALGASVARVDDIEVGGMADDDWPESIEVR
jgi:hypothetical protein